MTDKTVALENLLDTHKYLCGKARDIMLAKSHDYTSGSGDPFANFRGAPLLGIHPVTGMQLRQQDKMQRVRTFVEKGQLHVKGESVLDAILDQINYLVLQYAFIQEEKLGRDDDRPVPTDDLPASNCEGEVRPMEGRGWEERDLEGDSRQVHAERSFSFTGKNMLEQPRISELIQGTTGSYPPA